MGSIIAWIVLWPIGPHVLLFHQPKVCLWLLCGYTSDCIPSQTIATYDLDYLSFCSATFYFDHFVLLLYSAAAPAATAAVTTETTEAAGTTKEV